MAKQETAQRTTAAVCEMIRSWEQLPPDHYNGESKKSDEHPRLTTRLKTRYWSFLPGYAASVPNAILQDNYRALFKTSIFGPNNAKLFFSLIPLHPDKNTQTIAAQVYYRGFLTRKTATVLFDIDSKGKLVDTDGNGKLVDPKTHGEPKYSRRKLRKIRLVAEGNISKLGSRILRGEAAKS